MRALPGYADLTAVQQNRTVASTTGSPPPCRSAAWRASRRCSAPCPAGSRARSADRPTSRLRARCPPGHRARRVVRHDEPAVPQGMRAPNGRAPTRGASPCRRTPLAAARGHRADEVRGDHPGDRTRRPGHGPVSLGALVPDSRHRTLRELGEQRKGTPLQKASWGRVTFSRSPRRAARQTGTVLRPRVSPTDGDQPPAGRTLRCRPDGRGPSGLTPHSGPRNIRELLRTRSAWQHVRQAPDVARKAIMVCGCLLRTQQCVELVFRIGGLCQFVLRSLSGPPFRGGRVFVLSGFLLESLILAQDERWRRA